MAGQCPPLKGLLRFGRDYVDSDAVGAFRIRERGSRLTIAFSLNLDELCFAMRISGLLPGEPDTQAVEDYARQSIERLRTEFPEWIRQWITRALVREIEVTKSTDAEFLRWLEVENQTLHRWLGVPAVQLRISKIRRSGTPRQRQRLANVIAHRSDGRPVRLPDKWVIYHRVKDAQEALAPLGQFIRDANNKSEAWRLVQRQEPQVAAFLSTYGLDRRWFTEAERPQSQDARTVRVMAEELVAAMLGSTFETIHKISASVRASRRVKKPT